MKVLIVDDEEPARVEMRRLLLEHDDISIVGEAADVRTALALTNSRKPDVVFLDVRLVGETGFDYLAGKTDPGPRVVFVTAHDRFAIRGFECNALDYLLKPVRPSRLEETLRRIRCLETVRRLPEEDDSVLIKTGSTARFVPWMDIIRIESQGNYTNVYMRGEAEEIVVLRTLKDWLGLMPPGMFLQVHRSAVVRIKSIREVRALGGKRRELLLEDGSTILVGRGYYAEMQDALGDT